MPNSHPTRLDKTKLFCRVASAMLMRHYTDTNRNPVLELEPTILLIRMAAWPPEVAVTSSRRKNYVGDISKTKLGRIIVTMILNENRKP